MKKLMCAVAFFAIILSIFPKNATAYYLAEWSDYEEMGSAGGVYVYSAFKPSGAYGDSGVKLKFINANPYRVNVVFRPVITCENNNSPKSVSSQEFRLGSSSTVSSERELVINGAINCSITDDISDIKGQISVERLQD